jgi:hypothetical protein
MVHVLVSFSTRKRWLNGFLHAIQCGGERGWSIKYLRTQDTHAEYAQDEAGQMIGFVVDLLNVAQQIWQSLSIGAAAEVAETAVIFISGAADMFERARLESET